VPSQSIDMDNKTVPKMGEGSCGDVVVALCTSIVGFAFWTVVGVEACPDSSCSDTVPPQLPTPTALSMLLLD
jgi:hypothetical protein